MKKIFILLFLMVMCFAISRINILANTISNEPVVYEEMDDIIITDEEISFSFSYNDTYHIYNINNVGYYKEYVLHEEIYFEFYEDNFLYLDLLGIRAYKEKYQTDFEIELIFYGNLGSNIIHFVTTLNMSQLNQINFEDDENELTELMNKVNSNIEFYYCSLNLFNEDETSDIMPRVAPILPILPDVEEDIELVLASTDSILEHYDETENTQLQDDGYNKDDDIVDLIPKTFFFDEGVHEVIGSEFGYYMVTVKQSDLLYKVSIMLFDIDYYPFCTLTDGDEKFQLKIKPKVSSQYTAYKRSSQNETLWNGMIDDSLWTVVLNDFNENYYYMSNISASINIHNKSALNYGDNGYVASDDNGDYIEEIEYKINCVKSNNANLYGDLLLFMAGIIDDNLFSTTTDFIELFETYLDIIDTPNVNIYSSKSDAENGNGKWNIYELNKSTLYECSLYFGESYERQLAKYGHLTKAHHSDFGHSMNNTFKYYSYPSGSFFEQNIAVTQISQKDRIRCVCDTIISFNINASSSLVKGMVIKLDAVEYTRS